MHSLDNNISTFFGGIIVFTNIVAEIKVKKVILTLFLQGLYVCMCTCEYTLVVEKWDMAENEGKQEEYFTQNLEIGCVLPGH